MASRKHICFIIIVYLFTIIKINAQQLNYSLDFVTTQHISKLLQYSDTVYFTSIKSVSESYLRKINISDSSLNNPQRDKKYLSKHNASWLYRKLRKEDFIDFKSEDFSLKVNPLLHLEYKQVEGLDETFYTNTRGIEFKGNIGEKFSFYSSFYENQSRFVNYISNYVLENRIVPGQGAAKILNDNKYDYSRAEGYISYSPLNSINIQAGHSKFFIGEGYRSLLLSDNSFNYPFLKFRIEYGQFSYMILWNQYQLFEGAYYNYHHRKYGSINMLSWSPKSGFELALFESVTWAGNSPDYPNSFTANFFNPLILFRTVQYGLKSDKNIVVGLNLRKKISKFEQFYAQFVLDELEIDNLGKNKYGFQLGIKSFDIFRDKLSNQSLFILAEYNQIAPYTFAYSKILNSYSHYNQPLSHPAGAGLQEYVGIINYKFKDFFIEIKMNSLVNSIDTIGSNFGSNILLADNDEKGNVIGQGIKNTTQNIYASCGLIINPVTNMKIYIEIQKRTVSNTINSENSMFYSFGFKTDINNYYYDF